MDNPFVGLTPFTEQDRLFEREIDVERILGHFWAGPITVLFSGSGVGKSSFLNAKLVPHLREKFGSNSVELSDSWARHNPVEKLLELRLKLAEGRGTTVLVLDQFEEIFQYFPNRKLFAEVGNELSMILGKQPRRKMPKRSGPPLDTESAAASKIPTDVRLLIAIREEFLADLSMFDGILPGVFSNYYRLEKFSISQARNIIEKTALSKLVSVDANRLDQLLSELTAKRPDYVDAKSLSAKVAANNSTAENERHDVNVGITAGTIEPPYLQIACRGIWNREAPSREQPFLSLYTTGQAQEELHKYCHVILDSYGWRQRRVLSRVLPALSGPRQAKRAMRLSELSSEFNSDSPEAIRNALSPLSVPEVRILREWTENTVGVQTETGNQVYQLYHDMYAPLLWEWKLSQDKRTQRMVFASAFIATIVFVFFVIWPALSWAMVSNSINHPNGGPDETSDVMRTRNVLAWTGIWKFKGDSLWREYNERVAEQSALLGDMDGFMMRKLAAHGMNVSSYTFDVPGSLPSGSSPDLARYLEASYNATSPFLSDLGFFDGGTQNPSQRFIIGATRSGNIMSWQNHRMPVPINLPPGVALDTFTIVAFSPSGDKVLSAWKDESDDTKISIGVARLTIAVSDSESADSHLELSRPTNLFSISKNGPLTIDRIRGSFSPDGENIALISNGVLFAQPVAGPYEKGNRYTPCGDVSDLAFSKTNFQTIAFTYGPSFMQRIGRVTIGRSEDSIVCYGNKFTVPYGSKLVFRKSDDSLLLRHTDPTLDIASSHFPDQAGWVWVNPNGVIDGSEPIILPTGDLPQTYSDADGDLLSQSRDRRLNISHTSGGETNYETFAVTYARGQSAGSQGRLLTPASLAHFDSRHELLSFDSDDTTIRQWQLPLRSKSIKFRVFTRQEAPKPSVQDMGATIVAAKAGIGCPGNHQVSNFVSDRPEVTELLRGIAQLCYQRSGDRAIVVAQGSSVYYLNLDTDNPMKVKKTFRLGLREAVHDIAFGPGEDAVTVLAGSSLLVYRPQSYHGAEPEWIRKQGSLALLHESSYSEVFLVSRDKGVVHKLARSDGASSFADRLMAKIRLRSLTNQEPYTLDTMLVDEPIEVGLEGKLTNPELLRRLDFEKEKTFWKELDSHSLTSFQIKDCLAVQVNPRSNANKQGNRLDEVSSPKSASSPLCEWEARSGQSLGAGISTQ